MDRGIWKLRCQRCGEIFELKVNPGERVVSFAQEACCPSCHRLPDEPITWHHIVGYRQFEDEE